MRKQQEVSMATMASPSLYERLGGVYSIATVVDDLIDRGMADPRLNANPLVDEAHHKVPPAGFKYLVTEMLCWAAGGPQKYTGKDMESSHQHLRITPGEWEAFMDDVAQTLDKFTVPATERAEVVAIIETTRHSIVAAYYKAAHAAPDAPIPLRHSMINLARIGTVETICRYPVKSMAGEDVAQAFVGFAGLMGDRAFAFVRTPGPKGFPWHTGREQEDLVLFRPHFRERG